MSVTYNPSDPRYFDELDFRQELERVFDLCHGCRLCIGLCPSFPTLFDHIDAKDGDVAAVTRAEADEVVDQCYQCKLCYVKCPYVPPHEWEADIAALAQGQFDVLVIGGSVVEQERAKRCVMARVRSFVIVMG